MPFLKETKAFQLSFAGTKTSLYLYLENKRASQFDFVAGVLPDASRAGKVLLTGDAHLKLQNSLGRGEVIEINWKAPQPRTQDLQLHANYPFVFSSPFGVDGFLSIYKRDTLFINVQRSLGIQYPLGRGNYLKVFVSNKQTSLLQSKGFERATTLPSLSDITYTSYGLEFKSERLDYKFNPSKGYSLNIEASVGKKEILRNSAIPEIAYQNYLRSNQLVSTQYNYNSYGDVYIPVFSGQVIDLGFRAAGNINPRSPVLQNEYFRIGGLKTLRGFDEESIFVKDYVIAKLEYRFLLDQNSYLSVFYNRAYYESTRQVLQADSTYKITNVYDSPQGFGAGVSFETRLGIFSFVYALGKQFNNPIEFKSAKLHFGIISYF